MPFVPVSTTGKRKVYPTFYSLRLSKHLQQKQPKNKQYNPVPVCLRIPLKHLEQIRESPFKQQLGPGVFFFLWIT